ncbi:MAG: hypothetical protein HRT71_18115 [Flavobacteriales bacterium]|nr:hypothetical protein [Flavobacteriales bacterium]
MKTIRLNSHFKQLLKKNGLIEKTVKSKKLLGLTNVQNQKDRLKRILFNESKMEVLNRGKVLGSTDSLSEIQFRHLILFLTMDAYDFRRIAPGKRFNLMGVEKYIDSLNKELKMLQLYNTKLERQNAILNKLKIYQSVIVTVK